MGKSGKRNTDLPLQRVKNIELSDKNRMLRIILLVVLLVIAVMAFYFGIKAFLTTDPGWTQVEANADELNCSEDFLFQYCYGQSEESAIEEKKRLTLLYTEAVEDAWRIFHEEILVVGDNVNKAVTVDPALYRALEQIQSYGNRNLYLAPVYGEYNRIFTSDNDAVAAEIDPGQNKEQAAYVAELAAYANDPAMIDIQLLENDQVKLVVAPEYLAFAQENEITQFLDFGWMVNGFIADYLAQTLSDAGFNHGFLSSFDGFTRNLDDRGEQFNLNLFDRRENSVHLPGVMQYDRPIAIVFLRDYPMSQRDQYHYYTFSSGRIVTAYVDPADGLSKCATDSLVGFSYTEGCVDVMLQLCPVFLSDRLDTAALDTLYQMGTGSIWVEDTAVCCNDPSLQIKLNKDAGVDYTLQYIK